MWWVPDWKIAAFGTDILILLDLSAAFDTIDHDILRQRLQRRYRIAHMAREWFRSHLTDRQQCVHLSGRSSGEARLRFGVPQGSVLGPLVFILYTAPLGDIARMHGLELNLYADDTQVYMAFCPASINRTQTQQCARSTHVSQTFGRG